MGGLSFHHFILKSRFGVTLYKGFVSCIEFGLVWFCFDLASLMLQEELFVIKSS